MYVGIVYIVKYSITIDGSQLYKRSWSPRFDSSTGMAKAKVLLSAKLIHPNYFSTCGIRIRVRDRVRDRVRVRKIEK